MGHVRRADVSAATVKAINFKRLKAGYVLGCPDRRRLRIVNERVSAASAGANNRAAIGMITDAISKRRWSIIDLSCRQLRIGGISERPVAPGLWSHLYTEQSAAQQRLKQIGPERRKGPLRGLSCSVRQRIYPH